MPARGALDDPPRSRPHRRLPGSGLRRALSRAGRALRRGRARPRRRGSADARGGPPHRAVDVLPGHDPGRAAEDATGRMERVRAEAKAKPDQLLEVREFLHPQIDEITDTLPTALGAALRALKGLPARRRTGHPQGDDPQHDLGARLHAADDDGAARAAAPALAALRSRAGGDRALDRRRRSRSPPTDAELAREIVECQRGAQGLRRDLGARQRAASRS